MRLTVDLRSLAEKIPGGIPRYTRALVRTLLPYCADDTVVFFSCGKGERTRPVVDTGGRAVELRHLRLPNKLINACFRFFRRPYIDRLAGGTDVYFAPNINFIPLSPDVRFVLTVHDLSYIHFPHLMSAKSRMWHRAVHPEKLLHRADAIIAISHATKRDLESTCNISPEKIHVVHSAIDTSDYVRHRSDIIDGVRKRWQITRPYFLVLGNLDPRKNISTAISAYARLPDPLRRAHQLVIIGTPVWKKDAHMDHGKDIEGVRCIGFVNEETKIALLQHAVCLLFPSVYEGFGFPALESMAAGTPLIASSASSVPEVVGDAGILVDPHDPGAWASAIEQMCTDTELRATLIRRGRARVSEFTWQRSAQQTAEILHAI